MEICACSKREIGGETTCGEVSHLPVGDNLYKCLVSKDPEIHSSGLRRELRQLTPRLTSQLQISCPAQRRDHGGRRPRAPHRPQQDLHPAGVVPPLQEARPGPHLAPAPGVSWGQQEDDLTVITMDRAAASFSLAGDLSRLETPAAINNPTEATMKVRTNIYIYCFTKLILKQ